MSTLFDASSFLSTPLAEASATKRDPLPIGETYGQISKVDMVNGVAGPQAENPGKPWFKLNVVFDLQDPEYLSRAKRERASITYGLMLDVTDAGTIALGPNVNIRLGKLREATGVNQPGRALMDMVGQVCRLSIGNRPDPKDPSIVYDDVVAVAKF